MSGWVLGVDVGASGSRLSVVPLRDGEPDRASARRLDGGRLELGGEGSTAGRVMLELVGDAVTSDDRLRAGVRSMAAGIAGWETAVGDPASYLARVRELLPKADIVLTTDVVTAHVGALGEGGVVLAAGTGAIALGTDLDTIWHRVDGWGHLIGDLGSGAWIGMAGLRVAAAAADGRDPSGRALHTELSARLGPVHFWPGAIYRRRDRAGALADLAPIVEGLAEAGDAAARSILDLAASHLAETLIAAFVDGVPLRAALVGGLLRENGLLRGLVTAELVRRRPDVELRAALGTPLDGAVRLAALALGGRLPREGPLHRLPATPEK